MSEVGLGEFHEQESRANVVLEWMSRRRGAEWIGREIRQWGEMRIVQAALDETAAKLAACQRERAKLDRETGALDGGARGHLIRLAEVIEHEEKLQREIGRLESFAPGLTLGEALLEQEERLKESESKFQLLVERTELGSI